MGAGATPKAWGPENSPRTSQCSAKRGPLNTSTERPASSIFGSGKVNGRGGILVGKTRPRQRRRPRMDAVRKEKADLRAILRRKKQRDVPRTPRSGPTGRSRHGRGQVCAWFKPGHGDIDKDPGAQNSAIERAEEKNVAQGPRRRAWQILETNNLCAYVRVAAAPRSRGVRPKGLAGPRQDHPGGLLGLLSRRPLWVWAGRPAHLAKGPGRVIEKP